MKEKVIGVSREKLHEMSLEMQNNELAKKRNEEWLLTRPPHIQALAKRFDGTKVWRIKEGAPYSITCGGTIGTVNGFTDVFGENGEIREVLAIFVAHVLHYDETQHPAEKLERIEALDAPLQVRIDPEWVEEDPSPSAGE